MLKSNYQVLMLSYASKGHNHIAMMSNNVRVILHCTMTSLTLCCLVMTLPISSCYSSVVNKHQILALSVLRLYCGINIYSLQTECNFNHYLALQSFELT